MKLNKKILVPILISLALHVLLALVLWGSGQFAFKPKARPVAVELMDADQIAALMKRAAEADKTNGQIVEQDKRVNDEVAKDAKYMSKFNQKVIQETQAQLNGKFKNSADNAGERAREKVLGRKSENTGKDKAAVAKSEKAPKEKPRELLTSENGIATGKKPSLKDLTPSFRPGVPRVESNSLAAGGGDGPSATDDHLKDVRTGMQTMLSTREFVYYTYYNRIKDKLRQYWQPKIKEKVERIFRQGRTIASTGDKITKVIIVLDGQGILQKVQVLGPSGVTDLDDAAVEAFRAAAPFPNPPKGIIESDGTIKIRWDFILEAGAYSPSDEDPVGYAQN